MKRIVTSILLFLPLLSSAGEIASVNFKAIEDDLRTWYLSLPANSELKDRYLEASEGEKRRQEMLQKSMAKAKEEGKKADLSEYFAANSSAAGYRFKQELEVNLKKQLFLIVEEMGLEYDFIYDSSESDPVIYAKEGIDDITPLLRQHILLLTNDRVNSRSHKASESDTPDIPQNGPGLR